MAYISNLPNEMLARIGAFISKRLDLANLRLVNRRLSAVATEAYFANIALYPDWVDAVEDEGEKEEWQLEVEERRKAANWPNAIVYDVASFQRILDNKDFKRLVKRVTVYMCNPDCVSTLIIPSFNEYAYMLHYHMVFVVINFEVIVLSRCGKYASAAVHQLRKAEADRRIVHV